MRIHFLGSKKPSAQRAVQQLIDRYGQSEISDSAYLVCVGGDGTALNALQAVRSFPRTPVFAMRLPESVGALGNPFDVADLDKRLQTAARISIHPLRAEATTLEGKTVACFGINEIVVSRVHLQAAKVHVTISGMWTVRRLIRDGKLVATPLGAVHTINPPGAIITLAVPSFSAHWDRGSNILRLAQHGGGRPNNYQRGRDRSPVSACAFGNERSGGRAYKPRANIVPRQRSPDPVV